MALSKKAKTGLGAALLGIAIAGEAAAATSVTLYTWREQDLDFWEAVNQQNLIPDVKIDVKWIKADSYESKTRIDVQNGKVDLFNGKAGAAWLNDWITAGVVAPVNLDMSNITEAALTAATGPDGKLYGVPFVMQMESIIYNQMVFDTYGIKPDWKNLSELETDFATLKNAGIIPMHFAGRAGWYLNQVLNEVMTAGLIDDAFASQLSAGEACFTDQPYVDMLKVVEDWKHKGYLNPNPVADDYGAMRTAVALGDSAMMIDGVWSATPASPMYQIDPELVMGFAAVPGATNKIYGFGDATLLANDRSEHTEAANKVLKFATTKKFAELFATKVGALPAYSGEISIDNERVNLVSNMIANNALAATPFFAYDLNKGTPSYGQLVADNLQALLADKIDAATAAGEIQKGLNSWDYIGAAKCR